MLYRKESKDKGEEFPFNLFPGNIEMWFSVSQVHII